MSNETAVKTGETILLGGTHKEFQILDLSFPIRRMGIKSELLFMNLYEELVGIIKTSQSQVMEVLQGYMGGETNVKFGMSEGLDVVNQLFGKLPAFQEFAVKAVLVVAKAQKVEVTKDFIEENFGTMDCFEILAAQAEAQGLLSTFRSIATGFSTVR